MKLPLTPPDLEVLLPALTGPQLMQLVTQPLGPGDMKGRYLHWDKLRHLVPPEGMTPEVYWAAIKQTRKRLYRSIPLKDKAGSPLVFCIPETLMQKILWISEQATGSIEGDARVRDPKTRQQYLISSLMEESISSSQLEGASTTRRVARELLRSGRTPRDHSEQMIVNNYRAMRFIREYREEPLTPSLVFELHRILTEGTLEVDDQDKAGHFRSSADDICVFSKDDQLLHVPPVAAELEARLKALCVFANAEGEAEGEYIPPVVRAIIVHFMIGYDHPFVDGNGRTARALFYWVMARNNYWLMEYVSISRVIKQAPSQYMKAYLYTETDEMDLTYFLDHQLNVIQQAVTDLHAWLAEKVRALRESEEVLIGSSLQGRLNPRQLALLEHALKNPGHEYTIKEHQQAQGVVYQTARTDLMTLVEPYGLLRKVRLGKKDVFIAPAELKEKIAAQK
ncbi:Fic family protein [Marinospirillum sp.]|uniref:Fic family protein n=1 Tax=Marinospirillum sp. TaxID=2183934 RepID=UPI00384D680A